MDLISYQSVIRQQLLLFVVGERNPGLHNSAHKATSK